MHFIYQVCRRGKHQSPHDQQAKADDGIPQEKTNKQLVIHGFSSRISKNIHSCSLYHVGQKFGDGQINSVHLVIGFTHGSQIWRHGCVDDIGAESSKRKSQLFVEENPKCDRQPARAPHVVFANQFSLLPWRLG